MPFDFFFSQTASGIVVCLCIIAILIIFLALSLGVRRYYHSIQARIDFVGKHDTANELKFLGNGYLDKVARKYRSLFGKQVREMDLGAAMEKNLSASVLSLSNLVGYLPSLAIVLGLLGTFIGLTGAIQNIQISETSIDSIIGSLEAPLQNMATAFITSIFGMVASVIMTLFERLFRLGQLKRDTLMQVEDFFNTTYFDFLFSIDPEILNQQINDPAAMAITAAANNIDKAVDGLSQGVVHLESSIGNLDKNTLAGLHYSIGELQQAYMQQHDSIVAFNNSVGGYMETMSALQNSVRSIEDIQDSNYVLYNQLAETYKRLVEEHDMFKEALAQQGDLLVVGELNAKLGRIDDNVEKLTHTP